MLAEIRWKHENFMNQLLLEPKGPVKYHYTFTKPNPNDLLEPKTQYLVLSTLTNKEDFARAEKSHLRQFFSFYRKFESCDEDIRVFLYNTYCHNMYGIELWDSSEKCKMQFKSLSITITSVSSA